MGRTVSQIECNAQASTGNHRQAEGCAVAPLPEPQELEPLVPMRLLHPHQISAATLDDLLLDAKLSSGRPLEMLASDMHISAGYASRFLSGQCRQWAARMVRYCRATRSLAPLQKMADELGCDLVPRARAQAYIPERNACLPAPGRRVPA